MAEKQKKAKPFPDDELEPKRFIEAAKQLEVDETGKSFDDAFRIVSSSTHRTGPPRAL